MNVKVTRYFQVSYSELVINNKSSSIMNYFRMKDKIKHRHLFLILILISSAFITIQYNSIFIPHVSKIIGANINKSLSAFNPKPIGHSKVIINHLCNKTLIQFDNSIALNALKSNFKKNLSKYQACENTTDLPFVIEQFIHDTSISKNVFKICLKNFNHRSNDTICSATYFTKKMDVEESTGNLNFSKETNEFKLYNQKMCTNLNKSIFSE